MRCNITIPIEFVNRILENNKGHLEVYRFVFLLKGENLSLYQHYWRPWDEALRDIWVREMPKGL